MPLWLQNLLAILLVIACAIAVAYQSLQSLRGKKSKIGQCCAKGCAGHLAEQQAKTPENRIVFMPVEMLSRRRPR